MHVCVCQVLAACIYPELVESDKLPGDVKQRAQSLLSACDGGSVGKEDYNWTYGNTFFCYVFLNALRLPIIMTVNVQK
jgi:hypothetical protein